MVVLAILGIATSIVVALPPGRAGVHSSIESSTAERITVARRKAIRSGAPVTVTLQSPNDLENAAGSMSSRVRWATAFPDGSVIASTGLSIDRLTGRRSALLGGDDASR
jgi:Tfp pilus assembly protein FimT